MDCGTIWIGKAEAMGGIVGALGVKVGNVRRMEGRVGLMVVVIVGMDGWIVVICGMCGLVTWI